MGKIGKLVSEIHVDPQRYLDGAVGGAKALHDLSQACDTAAAARQKARERKAAKSSTGAERGRKGRPKGAANAQVDQADGQLTSCAKCGSTKRSKYFNRRDVNVAGVHTITGRPYTGIVIRRTACESCGQHRDDRVFVNEPPQGRRRK